MACFWSSGEIEGKEERGSVCMFSSCVGKRERVSQCEFGKNRSAVFRRKKLRDEIDSKTKQARRSKISDLLACFVSIRNYCSIGSLSRITVGSNPSERTFSSCEAASPTITMVMRLKFIYFSMICLASSSVIDLRVCSRCLT